MGHYQCPEGLVFGEFDGCFSGLVGEFADELLQFGGVSRIESACSDGFADIAGENGINCREARNA
jgi:hypothetical protein